MKPNLILMLIAMASSLAVAAPIANYDELMERARRGEYAPLLQALDGVPLQGRELSDYLTVAGWAGKTQVVIETYEAQVQGVKLPDYTLLQVARAYRDTGRWEEALALYGEGMRRFHQDDAFELGSVMTLADAGRLPEALQQAQRLVQQKPRDADRRLALAYVYVREGKSFAALAEADRAYGIAPQRDDVAREYVLALQRVRMPGSALRVARSRPGVVDAQLLRSLEGDAAAELARLSQLPSRGEAERFTIADRALANFDRLTAQWSAEQPRPDADLRRLRIDRIVALHARVRMQELVAEYESLRSDGSGVPAYVLSNVASAYLYLREPEKARKVYEESLQTTSVAGDEQAWQDDETGLYYALIESERFADAGAVVRKAQERQPVWLWRRGTEVREPNDLKLSADQLMALHHLYSNDTRKAQHLLDGMVEQAPNNTDLRTGRAGILRARSLPRSAEAELKMAETLEPRARGVELGQGFNALALREWRQAGMLRDDVMLRFPENRSAQRLDREWEVHNKAELKVDGYRGLKSSNPVVGSRERGIDAVLYSPPIAYNWRAFAGGGHAFTRFDEGPIHYRWTRVGAQWRGRDLEVEGEVSNNRYGSGDKTGVGISVAYDLDDHWQVGGSAAQRSRGTPLRALEHGIHANRIDTYVRWRADDQREWRLGIAPSRFSDGNRRIETFLSGQERFYSAPHVWVDGLLDLSASRNSSMDTAYFNPRSDFSALPAIRATHILYRRYQTVWEHHLTLGAGAYAQRGFGSGTVGMWEYGQRYRTNDVFEVGVSISGLSRPYDGRRDHTLRAGFDMTFRF